MSGTSITCKLLITLLIICMIVVPVLANEPFDKAWAIAFLVGSLPWIIVAFILDVRDSAELETKIKLLEDRVKELEDKNK